MQFAFSMMSGVDPEEPLWQRPERRFRPFGRIFHEKCGLNVSELVLVSTKAKLWQIEFEFEDELEDDF